ncbi:MAG: penicillin-binding protein 1C [Rhodothermaceae bacterium]|nr:penicillin-binding protein 1C [Rhodothermaceae bacterium]
MIHFLPNIIRFTSSHKTWAIPVVLFVMVAIYFLWPTSAVNPSESISSTKVLDRDGRLLREIRPEGRGIWVSLDKVQPFATQALIATEDRNFYAHRGVDPKGIARAIRDNIKARRIISGASTLSMQVARMRLGYSSRSIVHKLHEVALATRIEIHNSKQDVLNAWLNQAYFGNQVYGIESASQFYFGKTALDLTASEAAYLIGLPQNPIGYNPHRYPETALKRYSRVLEALVETSHISAKTHERLLQANVQILPKEEVFRAPHFVEWLKAQQDNALLQQPLLKTSLDVTLQTEIEALARGHLDRLNSEYITNAAAVVVDNINGEILAYMGSIDYWNERIEGQNDGVRMLRQPGSTLKPFTYALALESKAYTPASVLPDVEVQIPEAGGAFAPKNYDKTYHGPVPLREALANSYNVPAVRLARDLGVPLLLDKLHEAGFSSLTRTPDHYGVGLTLGNGEVQLLELVRAYATLARQGYPLELTPFPRSSSQSQHETPILSPDVAYLITDILSDPEAREAAFGRSGPLELPFPTAVKTGTSKDYRDNWAVGYTPKYTVAVWVGNFDGSPMQKVSGVSGAGPLFKSIMLYLGDSGHFEDAQDIEIAVICPLSGQKPTSVCLLRKKELFIPGTVPRDSCGVHKEVLIDSRSNLLATPSTPSSFVRPTLFTALPAIYHPWMREKEMAFPPTEYSSEQDLVVHESAQARHDTESALHIAYPVSGMIFQLDPILRSEYQKIRLEGIVPDGVHEISWWINETRWDANTATTMWPLEEGIHTIELRREGFSRGASVQIQVVN